MKLAIVGSRDHHDVELAREHVFTKVASTPLDTVIVSGGARGGDTYARQAAKFYRRKLVEFLPRYDLYGKAAATLRNFDIAMEADECFAVTWGSGGTANCLGHFRTAVKQALIVKVPFIQCDNPRCELGRCKSGRNVQAWQRKPSEPWPRPLIRKGDVIDESMRPVGRSEKVLPLVPKPSRHARGLDPSR